MKCESCQKKFKDIFLESYKDISFEEAIEFLKNGKEVLFGEFMKVRCIRDKTFFNYYFQTLNLDNEWVDFCPDLPNCVCTKWYINKNES